MFLIVFAWTKGTAPSQPWLAGDSLLERTWQTCQLRRCRWQNLPGLRRKKRIPSAATWGDSTSRRSAEWNQPTSTKKTCERRHKDQKVRRRHWLTGAGGAGVSALRSLNLRRWWRLRYPKKPQRASVCTSHRLSIISLRQGWQLWWWDAQSFLESIQMWAEKPLYPRLFMTPKPIYHFQPFTLPITISCNQTEEGADAAAKSLSFWTSNDWFSNQIN